LADRISEEAGKIENRVCGDSESWMYMLYEFLHTAVVYDFRIPGSDFENQTKIYQ